MNACVRTAALCALAALGPSCTPAAPAITAPPPAVAAIAPAAPAAPAVPAVDPSGDWELRWDRTFAGWQPPLFEGKLSLQRQGSGWTGQLAFRQSSWKPVFDTLRIDGDHLALVFHSSAAAGGAASTIELSGWIREGRIIGEMRTEAVGWTPVGGRRLVLPQLNRASVAHALPPVDLAASGADAAALSALLDHARDERSSAIVLVKDGKIGLEAYREGYDGGPLVAMSASKSLVSLAVGMLVAEGKLSLEATMGSLLPEWKSLGPKAAITVRQLLTHTSGLDPSRASWDTETIREHALRAALLFPPGTRFQYNNGAVDLLCVVFQKVAGVPLDAYLEARLFQKLDVVGATWKKDKEGTPRGAGELFIRPVDLAKIGQLMLDGGTWRGERLLPAAWIERSVAAGQPFHEDCGLLWWREGAFARVLTEPVLSAWHDLGVDDAALQRARPLVGKRFAERHEYGAAIAKALGGAAWKKLDGALVEGDHTPFSGFVSDGPVRGFAARGWLGQYLVVLPRERVVAVRMRSPEGSDYGANGAEHGERDGYPGFGEDAARLFPERGAAR